MATPETVHRQPIHPAWETFGPMTAGSETRAERTVRGSLTPHTI